MKTSPMKTALRAAFAVVLLALAMVPSAVADVVGTALGPDGELVSLLSGPYGEIFPDAAEAQAEVPVLALRRILPDGQELLTVVPATLDQDSEESAELIIEPVSGVSYIFWQSWTSLIHSRFRITSFDGESWGDPVDVSESAFAWRTSPAFAVTRDSFVDLTDEGKGQVNRTVLHVVWSEEGDDGSWVTKYAPLVLEDGEYIGEHPVLVLNDLIPPEAGAVGTELRVAPALHARDGENSAVAAFLDQLSGKLVVVELRFAAGELSILGNVVAAEIDSVASRTDLATSQGREELLASVRGRLMAYEDHVKTQLLDPLASELERHLRDQLPGAGNDVGRVRGDARAHLIDVGFRLTDGRVQRVTAVARAHLIDVGARDDRPRRNHRHDARSSVMSSRNVPQVTAAPELLVSTKGNKLMLVWSGKDRVRYQETKADGGWSPVQQLQLTAQLDATQAMDILRRRVEQ